MEQFNSPWLIYDNLPLPLIILNSSWEIQRVNRAYEAFFGQGTKELFGLTAGDLFGEIVSGDSDSPWSYSSLISLAGAKVAVVFRVTELDPNHYLITVVPSSEEAYLRMSFSRESGEILGASTNEQSTALNAQQQLSLLGHLAGGVAHDLNNILTGVLGHLSLLRNSAGTGAFLASLSAAEDGAKKACATAQQILEFARGREGKRRKVELSEVVRKVVSLLRVSLPKNIQLKSQLEQLYVLGDESELTQLLMNLAINARDAMPDGGDIAITLTSKFEDGFELAMLTVKDSGHGIPVAVQQKMFEPFFTTKEMGKGTGLGLSNVKRTLHRLGGTIQFETSDGAGTVFSVFLPCCEPEVEEEAPRAEIQNAQPDEKILIVEDEETVRLVMERSLEHLGYAVIAADNGKTAIEIFQKDINQFDLVVLDVMMPEMAGDELFFKLRELNPDIPCLVASGYASEKRTGKMLAAGRCGYIQKPFGVEDLALEVRRCIDDYRLK
jgi:two-component system cell cycle sensor histidine kinase/response regulator CckA